MKKDMMFAYSDGSSRGNPGPGGWGAIIVFKDKVVEKGGYEKLTTNNKMELSGAIGALKAFGETEGDIIIHTDSQYVKRGITEWVYGWKRNGWKTKTKEDVSNKELWEELSELETKRKKFGAVEWKYVPGHVGHPINERVDTIATSFADGKPEKLFSGAREEYPVDIEAEVVIDVEAVAKRSASRAHSKAKAYSYLSVINGKAYRYTSWPECEAHVKGEKAKFKKAISAEDEKNILKEWGVKL
jgi:ribonuclease HI